MLTAVREDKAAAAKRSSTVASKAGTSRRRGKEPVPMADPLIDTFPDLASASAEPDTQRLDSATGPHLVDRSSAPAPPLSIPGNPAPSPESDPGLKEAVQRLATRIKLIAEEGVHAKHEALYKYLVEAETPVLPAWPADTIPCERQIKARAHRICSHPERDGGKRRPTVSMGKLRPR
ncbi:hypothetical protein ACKKBF_B39690 [Auxenochlorella protothecoides x Auxenochlorella symbiontica]